MVEEIEGTAEIRPATRADYRTAAAPSTTVATALDKIKGGDRKGSTQITPCCSMKALGLEPRTDGLKVRCSTN